MMGWNNYPKTTPREVKDGIAVRKKRGDIGGQWWSKQFLDALNRLGMDNRLARGRAYARKGQVVSIDIRSGVVHAFVQGSRRTPYEVTIRLKEWDHRQWKKVVKEIGDQALYAAELLAGEMPHDIEEVVEKARVHLFPVSRDDLITTCSCPDYANPCKHIAAVYYILAERLDEDPFLIFAMRGSEKEDLLDGLRAERGNSEPEVITSLQKSDIPDPQSPVIMPVAGFFDLRESLDDFEIHLTNGPEVKGALLRRLGPSPLSVGKQNFCDLIAPVYDFAPEYVQQIIHGGDDDPGT